MQTIIDLFERYAQQLPLELFVLVGSFIEELISPIPSFVVLVPAGVAAQTQHIALWYLGILALLAAAGRLAGAIILYWVADKFEDRVLADGRRFFGLTHKQVERFGQTLGQNSHKEWIVLFLMNAVPIFPAAALSLSCGFVKVRHKVFVLCTFFGSAINAIIYMLIGYGGYQAATTVQSLERASQVLLVILVVGVGIWLVRRKAAKHLK